MANDVGIHFALKGIALFGILPTIAVLYIYTWLTPSILLLSVGGRNIYGRNKFENNDSFQTSTILNFHKVFAIRNKTSPLHCVLFNAMPKTGSRTLYTLAKDLSRKRGFLVKTTEENLVRNETKSEKMEREVNGNKPVFIYSHLPFVDMTDKTDKTITYISIVREPIDRLVSLYYYKLYGDGMGHGQFTDEMKISRSRSESFDECVLREGPCISHGVLQKTLIQFCGLNLGFGVFSKKTCLEKAKQIIKDKYTVVGVTADYMGFIQVLERRLPGVFTGATVSYENFLKKNKLRRMKTKKGTDVSVGVRQKLRAMMNEEYELYEFIKREFETMKKELNISYT